ncbi:class I poly(R)-hydroxyalkanoic acid synthase [Paracoccus fistulariae]|uniref:class I poly(R)-hydroxyalkanoic acid synthase n=1 Tax=Paracoccus fistulariae TaxID=658446 RepID=UPI00234FF90D|nr:class I poly(R)-hydroxyalkanoic acid synthase [Paracoccus fistulariae]
MSSPTIDSSPISDPAAVMREAMKIGASAPAAQRLAENIERIEALSHRLMAAFTSRGLPNPGVEGPGPELFMTATNAWMKTITEQPGRMIEQQVNFWGQTLKNYANAQSAMAKGRFNLPEDDEESRGRKDKRFANELWQTHPYFKLVKNQYHTNVRALKDAAEALDLSDEVARRRIDWLTNQIIDMISPTNFLATNPDALEKAVATEGESLVKGLENLVQDVEASGGEMVVSLADRDAFTVGENIGNSEGMVVHRTPLFELIQYKPTTDEVYEMPLLILPPWINKFYILDLKPQNSLIRHMVGQGYTVFIVSWKNPDSSYSEVGIEEYIAAYLDAMDVVRERTGQKKLNAVGYCIAGTTLSLALALMQKRGDDRVNSATLFTTLTDFSDQGEFVTFLQDDFVSGIAEEVSRHGLMRAQLMSRTMSFLRANDLVWGPAIRSYMMGETPPAFDLLFWNGDSTNLPGRMAMQYLKGLCQENAFAGNGFELLGESLRLSDVKLPLCAVSCETDHIAPWKDCWRGVAAMGSEDKTFILSESGHIAGIVNPPSKKKYGHYMGCRDFAHGAEKWRDDSTFYEGSWWPHWDEWLSNRSGKKVPARELSEGLEPAPGTYVHERAI